MCDVSQDQLTLSGLSSLKEVMLLHFVLNPWPPLDFLDRSLPLIRELEDMLNWLNKLGYL